MMCRSSLLQENEEMYGSFRRRARSYCPGALAFKKQTKTMPGGVPAPLPGAVMPVNRGGSFETAPKGTEDFFYCHQLQQAIFS
jgi:hypothetical protein